MKIHIFKVKSRGKFKWGAWIIRKNQKTEWNHYGIAWFTKDGNMMVTDAKRKGIRKITFAEFCKKYEAKDIAKIKLPISLDEWEAWVDSKVGTRYGVMQLFGIAMITWGFWKRNPFGKDKKYLVCHEYVLITLARFLKIELDDTDDYNFKKADEVIDSVREDDKDG